MNESVMMTDNDIDNYVIVGWTDPNMRVQNIPILKNATKFFSHHAELLHWQFKPVPINKKISRFVILRDPYERWLTAFVEDIKMFINSREKPGEKEYLINLFNQDFSWFLDFLIDKDVVCFDTHAQLQVNQLDLALRVLGKDKITFIKFNDKLGYFINHWLHSEGCSNNFNNGKINSRDKSNDKIYQTLSTYMMDGKNLTRKEKILEYLTPDFKLYNSVNFINPT